MNEPRILSFKLIRKGKRRGVEVTSEAEYVDGKGAIVKIESPAQFHKVEAHPDLLALMHQLSPHYAFLTEREEFDAGEAIKPETVLRCASQYPVGSFQWKSGKDWSGCMMHGHKVLSTGHACPALTRLVRFNSPNDGYALSDELEELSEDIRKEVVALLGGKHGETPDLFTTAKKEEGPPGPGEHETEEEVLEDGNA